MQDHKLNLRGTIANQLTNAVTGLMYNHYNTYPHDPNWYADAVRVVKLLDRSDTEVHDPLVNPETGEQTWLITGPIDPNRNWEQSRTIAMVEERNDRQVLTFLIASDANSA